MHQAAHTYARVSQAALTPRETEASVLLKAASRIQAIRDDWQGKQADLDGALAYNRKLWTILVAAVADDGNPIPVEIKQNILNLGLFTFNQTLSALAEPKAEKLGVLVTINREIAAGLRTAPPQAA